MCSPYFHFQCHCTQPGRMENCGARIDPYKLNDLMVDWLWLFNQTSIIRGLANYQMTDFSAQGCRYAVRYVTWPVNHCRWDGISVISVKGMNITTEMPNQQTFRSQNCFLSLRFALQKNAWCSCSSLSVMLVQTWHVIKVLAAPCKAQAPTTGFLLVWSWCHGEIEVKWSGRWKLSLLLWCQHVGQVLKCLHLPSQHTEVKAGPLNCKI